MKALLAALLLAPHFKHASALSNKDTGHFFNHSFTIYDAHDGGGASTGKYAPSLPADALSFTGSAHLFYLDTFPQWAEYDDAVCNDGTPVSDSLWD